MLSRGSSTTRTAAPRLGYVDPWQTMAHALLTGTYHRRTPMGLIEPGKSQCGAASFSSCSASIQRFSVSG